MTSLIGRRMLRREDRPLLTGQAEFVDDLELEGMLHIRFFRSPIAHGRIEALDLEAARAVPGVVAVLGPDDVPVPPLHPPIENPDAHSPPRPQLAKGVVRFVGEPMAVIVADSPYAAEDAAELIEADARPAPRRRRPAGGRRRRGHPRPPDQHPLRHRHGGRRRRRRLRRAPR